MGRQLYAMHDSNPKNHSLVQIKIAQAADYNARGYGIFMTVNEFNGPRRIANLSRLCAWAVDIDDGSKEEQLKKIKSGLVPSFVIESKRGYQPHWLAKDAKPEHWNAIVLDRLVPFYGADRNARDIARILRAPGFYHLKDPANPFMVRKVWSHPVAYTEMQMANFYPSHNQTKCNGPEMSEAKRAVPVSGSFWDRVWHLDCEEALTRLSGHAYVGGETYSFRPNHSGTRNIFVNGKTSSCWIDRNGRIGSFDKGGPSIFQWLNWFHKNPTRVVEMIKEVFPECRT